MTFGSRSPIAIEAAYVGSAQGINALGLDTDALLVGQGAEGNLRLNLTTRRVQPYLFGGIGWTRYNLERSSHVDVQREGVGRRRHRADGRWPHGAPDAVVLHRRPRYLPVRVLRRHAQRRVGQRGAWVMLRCRPGTPPVELGFEF